MYISNGKYSVLYRAIALALVCLFFVNDISWALDSSVIARPSRSSSLRGAEGDEAISKLAAQSVMPDREFREKVMFAQFRISVEAMMRHLNIQLKKEKGIFRNKWKENRVQIVGDIYDPKVRGRIKGRVDGLKSVAFVRSAGFMAATGQMGWVDVNCELETSKEFGGIPVVYIDSTLCDAPDRCVQRHETDEILQWEYLRVNVLGIKDNEGMADWIKAYINSPDKKLDNTDYEGMNSHQVAQLFCGYSYPLRGLYEKMKGSKDFGYRKEVFDFDYIWHLIQRCGTDERSGRVNIAAKAAGVPPDAGVPEGGKQFKLPPRKIPLPDIENQPFNGKAEEVDKRITYISNELAAKRIDARKAAQLILEFVLPCWAYSDGAVTKAGDAIKILRQHPRAVYAKEALQILELHKNGTGQSKLKEALKRWSHRFIMTMFFLSAYKWYKGLEPPLKDIMEKVGDKYINDLDSRRTSAESLKAALTAWRAPHISKILNTLHPDAVPDSRNPSSRDIFGYMSHLNVPDNFYLAMMEISELVSMPGLNTPMFKKGLEKNIAALERYLTKFAYLVLSDRAHVLDDYLSENITGPDFKARLTLDEMAIRLRSMMAEPTPSPKSAGEGKIVPKEPSPNAQSPAAEAGPSSSPEMFQNAFGAISDQAKQEFMKMVQEGIEEDVGSGDITSLSTIPQDAQSEAIITAKKAGVLCGIDAAILAFRKVDKELQIIPELRDGAELKEGDVILRVKGRTRSILTAERTALNIMQRYSGIATLTRKFVDSVKGTRAVILDTRKTTPGRRFVEKYAVKCGGGENHRMGLFDQVLIKTPHIKATGSITAAIQAAQRENPGKFIEVEVTNIAELREALKLGVDRILLDNMTPEDMAACVRIVYESDFYKTEHKPALEASGNVNLETAAGIAKTGVDYISVGQLTHSAPALDIHLEHVGTDLNDADRFQWYSWPSLNDKMRVIKEGIKEDRGEILQVGLWDEAITGFLRSEFPMMKIVGIDKNPDFVASAKRKFPSMEFLPGDITAWPDYQPHAGRYDIIVLGSTLHSIYFNQGPQKARSAIELMAKLLKPQGRLIIRDGLSPAGGMNVITMKNSDAQRAFVRFVHDFKGRHVNVYDPDNGSEINDLENHFNRSSKVKLRSEDEYEFLMKYIYFGAETWGHEMSSAFGVLSEKELLDITAGAFTVEKSEVYRLPYLEEKWSRDFEITDGAFPQSHIALILKKKPLSIVPQPPPAPSVSGTSANMAKKKAVGVAKSVAKTTVKDSITPEVVEARKHLVRAESLIGVSDEEAREYELARIEYERAIALALAIRDESPEVKEVVEETIRDAKAGMVDCEKMIKGSIMLSLTVEEFNAAAINLLSQRITGTRRYWLEELGRKPTRNDLEILHLELDEYYQSLFSVYSKGKSPLELKVFRGDIAKAQKTAYWLTKEFMAEYSEDIEMMGLLTVVEPDRVKAVGPPESREAAQAPPEIPSREIIAEPAAMLPAKMKRQDLLDLLPYESLPERVYQEQIAPYSARCGGKLPDIIRAIIEDRNWRLAVDVIRKVIKSEIELQWNERDRRNFAQTIEIVVRELTGASGRWIMNIRSTIRYYRPCIMLLYDDLPNLIPEQKDLLRKEIYTIDSGQIEIWGLGIIGNKRLLPCFKGSYVNALIAAFPGIELDPLGFRLDWTTRDRAIASLRFVLSKEIPDIVKRYDDLNNLDRSQIRALRRDIYQITQAHFKAWQLINAIDRDHVQHFNGSFIDALIAVFPGLNLNRLGFWLDWSTRESAIESVRFVLSQEVPDIVERYDRIDTLEPKEVELLRRDIYGCMTAGRFKVWGLDTIASLKWVPYFNASYIEALIVVFPKLALNPLGFHLEWSSREQASESIRYVLAKEAPYILERYDKIGSLSSSEIKVLRDDICAITNAHFQVWGLNTAMNRKSAPYFEGSYINALLAVFEDERLGLTIEAIEGFRKAHAEKVYHWDEGKKEAIKNIHDAIRRNRPDIMERCRDMLGLRPREVEALKRDIYRIDHAYLKLWGVSALSNMKSTPYFEGNYSNALVAAFPGLDLDPLGFKLDWSSRGRAVASISFVLSKEVPDIMERYGNIRTLDPEAKETLRRDIYQRIGQHEIVAWGLASILRKKEVPYFNGRYIDALTAVFSKLGLDTLGFRLDWSSRGRAIASIRFILGQQVPDIMKRYDDRGRLVESQKEILRKDIYRKITAGRLELWKLANIFNKDQVPYFNGSYIDVMTAVFPDLDLNPLGFQLDWSTREKGIESLQYVFRQEAPSIMERYENVDALKEAEKEPLKHDIYAIGSAHLNAWGATGALHEKRAPYFHGSCAEAVAAVFPKLDLNPLGFQLDWSTREKAIESLRFVFARKIPDILKAYDKVKELSLSQLEGLRAGIYGINWKDFIKWGLSSVLNKRTMPHFNGSPVEALLAVFSDEKLALKRNEFLTFRKFQASPEAPAADADAVAADGDRSGISAGTDLGLPREPSQNTNERVSSAIVFHEIQFGEKPETVATGPGRISLFGQHIDYAGGNVLAIALDGVNIIATASKRTDQNIVICSPRFGEYKIDAETLRAVPTGAKEGLKAIPEEQGWARYPIGVIRQLMECPGVTITGFNLAYDGNIPIGDGLSSSAAIETAVFTALDEILKTGLNKKEAAKLCQAAEHWRGNMCGIMDQFVSLNGERMKAILLNCSSLESKEIDIGFLETAGYAIAVVDTGLRKTKENWNAYGARRTALNEAIEKFFINRPEFRVNSISDIAPGITSEIFMQIGKDLKAAVGEKIYNKIRHIVNENERVKRAAIIAAEANALAKAVLAGDRSAQSELEEKIKEFGAVLLEGHESSDTLYETSSPQLNNLVESAMRHGSIGSRLTGAGFVGCTVNIVKQEDLDRFKKGVISDYNAVFRNLPLPKIMISQAGAGARTVDLTTATYSTDLLEGSAVIPEPRTTDKATCIPFKGLPQYRVDDARPKGVLVIGAGHIGPRHLAAMPQTFKCLSGEADVKIVGLVDNDPDEERFRDKARAVKHLFTEVNKDVKPPDCFRSVEEALSYAKGKMALEPRDIIALVCVPNEYHLRVSSELAKAGIEMICIEKPLANTLSDIDGILALQKDKNLRMACVTQFLFSLAFQEVLSFIKELSAKKVRPVNWSTFYSKDRSTGKQAGKNITDPHIFLYELIHQLALAWQISPADEMTYARAEDMTLSDGTVVRFHGRGIAGSRHKNGMSSVNITDFTRPGITEKQKIFNVHFSDGSVLAVNFAPDKGYISHFVYYSPEGNVIRDFVIEETVMDMLVLGDAAWLYALLSNNEAVPFSDFPGKTNATSLTFHRDLMRVIHRGIDMTRGLDRLADSVAGPDAPQPPAPGGAKSAELRTPPLGLFGNRRPSAWDRLTIGAGDRFMKPPAEEPMWFSQGAGLPPDAGVPEEKKRDVLQGDIATTTADAERWLGYNLAPLAKDLMEKLPDMTIEERMKAIAGDRGISLKEIFDKAKLADSMLGISGILSWPGPITMAARLLQVDPILLIKGADWRDIVNILPEHELLQLLRVRKGWSRKEFIGHLEAAGFKFSETSIETKINLIADLERGKSIFTPLRKIILSVLTRPAGVETKRTSGQAQSGTTADTAAKPLTAAEQPTQQQAAFDTWLGYQIRPVSESLSGKLPFLAIQKRIEAIMIERNMSWDELSRKSSLSIRVIKFLRTIDNAVNNPKKAMQIARALEIDPIIIVRGKGWAQIEKTMPDNEKILWLRMRKGWGITEFVIALECAGLDFRCKTSSSKVMIASKWESGYLSPGPERAAIIGKVLGCEVFLGPEQQRRILRGKHKRPTVVSAGDQNVVLPSDSSSRQLEPLIIRRDRVASAKPQSRYDNWLGYYVSPVPSEVIDVLPDMAVFQRIEAIMTARGMNWDGLERGSGFSRQDIRGIHDIHYISSLRKIITISPLLEIDPILIIEGRRWDELKEGLSDGEKMTYLRLRKGWTMVRLVRELEKEGVEFNRPNMVSKRVILSNFETGKSRPKREDRTIMRKVLGDKGLFIDTDRIEDGITRRVAQETDFENEGTYDKFLGYKTLPLPEELLERLADMIAQDRLEAILKARGMDWKYLSRKTGCSITYLKRVMVDGKIPMVDVLYRIARTLKIDAIYIIRGKVWEEACQDLPDTEKMHLWRVRKGLGGYKMAVLLKAEGAIFESNKPGAMRMRVHLWERGMAPSKKDGDILRKVLGDKSLFKERQLPPQAERAIGDDAVLNEFLEYIVKPLPVELIRRLPEMTVQERIAAILEARGMSWTDLAGAVLTSELSRLQNIGAGNKLPTAKLLYHIARALWIDGIYIIKGRSYNEAEPGLPDTEKLFIFRCRKGWPRARLGAELKRRGYKLTGTNRSSIESKITGWESGARPDEKAIKLLRAITGDSTLYAPQPPAASKPESVVLKKVNGFRSIIPVLVKISDEKRIKGFADELRLPTKMQELLRVQGSKYDRDARGELLGACEEILCNSFDAIVDRIKEIESNSGSLDFEGKIIVEVFLEGDDVAINILDNGKTVEFQDNGVSLKKRPSLTGQFRSKGRGVFQSRMSIMYTLGGTIEWTPLKEGSRIKIKIPKNKMPPEFYINQDEYIITEVRNEGFISQGAGSQAPPAAAPADDRKPSVGHAEGLVPYVSQLYNALEAKDYVGVFDIIMDALESVPGEDEIGLSVVNFRPFKNNLADFITAVYPGRAGPGYDELSSLITSTDILDLLNKLKSTLPILKQKQREIRAFVFRAPLASGSVAGPVAKSKEIASSPSAPRNDDEEMVAQNVPDIENLRQMLYKIAEEEKKVERMAAKGGQVDYKYYTIGYDVTKIPQNSPAEELLKYYCEKVLGLWLNGDHRVKLVPSNTQDRGVIWVECYKDQPENGNKIGEGRVYIEEFKDSEAMRLIGMLNMAFLASQIPADLPPDRRSEYEALTSVIEKQFSEISGESPTSDTLKFTPQGIYIKLPHAAQIPLDKTVDEYYRLTITQLEQAA
jgi:nicotinate-nucleotide pyrophosphorylase (carboxylating)